MTARYVIGFWCVKGGGHLELFSDEDYEGSCGNGYEVVLREWRPPMTPHTTVPLLWDGHDFRAITTPPRPRRMGRHVTRTDAGLTHEPRRSPGMMTTTWAGARRPRTRSPLTAIRETCPCGAAIRIQHPDPAPIAAQWRDSHPCDRRAGAEREVVSGAQNERSHTEPHRTDSDLGQRIGFTPPPHPNIHCHLDGREITRVLERYTARTGRTTT